MDAATALLKSQATGVLTLTFNRPASMNAFTRDLLGELFETLRAAHADPEVRCIVVTGAGDRAFSAGADIKAGGGWVEPDEERLYASTRDYYSAIFRTLRGVEKPIIAALNGVAAGAGLSLALACDLRIAAQHASFVGAFTRIGITPDSGATLSLPHLLGLGRAAEFLWSGRRMYADEALRLGLVNRVVPSDSLGEAAYAWAAELATLSTTAIGLTKRAFNRAVFPQMDEILELEARLVARTLMTHDAREGMASLLERREPRFTGQ
ncbi:MAG: 2-(1,2-epoxy-1,2-dihydrophenyl)acetyl-CoA isomerase [Chloroflexi bacterium]|nr:MAG: 2-(1,2-epoxy-1,2-dihydrophenyl)acetyl-CoA isomerase [Chloroflexota bacterium]